MDTNSRGALVPRKRVHRLIGMIILLCCVIAPFVASPLFKSTPRLMLQGMCKSTPEA